MENLMKYYDVVEQAIAALGIDPKLCRDQEQGKWNLKKGSAPIWIDLTYSEKDKRAYFQVMAPITKVPTTNREKFFEELLEINYILYGVSFTKYDDRIYIKVIREVEGLDVSEALAAIERIGYYGDFYDDYFQNKYAVQR
ncbi:MAG: YbjN domain-containing protein [Bacteroidia bacterium]|nr:YbjN domain-containing protein [Bacteroidia bacterium]MDW8302421.1 YbjN domain-containing protein [Bacteroidia bacterium]